LLTTALQAGADEFVTNDKALLDVRELEGMHIRSLGNR